ncbi:hypothetical protein C7378_1301 [Acidipila rosea]|uniref:Uncharacterized protein n=1 Tax=Acidipila rosea TaxID=768535 RepID=A0A4R1L691_9BACT|nr:hypothetical protein C7378_1301 [Acidipila rosea]
MYNLLASGRLVQIDTVGSNLWMPAQTSIRKIWSTLQGKYGYV